MLPGWPADDRGIAAMFHDATYLVESLLIRAVVQGTAACKELFLLCAFRIQYFQADKPSFIPMAFFQ